MNENELKMQNELLLKDPARFMEFAYRFRASNIPLDSKKEKTLEENVAEYARVVELLLPIYSKVLVHSGSESLLEEGAPLPESLEALKELRKQANKLVSSCDKKIGQSGSK